MVTKVKACYVEECKYNFDSNCTLAEIELISGYDRESHAPYDSKCLNYEYVPITLRNPKK
jgi:hypothetical protein